MASCNVLQGRAWAEWLIRHVQRRVELTLGLGGEEPRSGAGAPAPRDLPARVRRLECFWRERDHFAGRRSRQDEVDSPGSGPRLQFGQNRAAILRSRRGQGRGIYDHEAGRDVGQPAPELDHERVKATRELLRDRAALRRLYGAEVLIEQEHFGVVSSKEQSAREGRRA